MAIGASPVFEVRLAGGGSADTNGGGWITGGSGTDYSQTDAKRTATGTNDSVTDAVGNSTTTVTSATANFTSALIGNVIYFDGNWFEVTAVGSTTSITVDRNTTTGSGLTLNIGGAWATITNFANDTKLGLPANARIRVWVKASTFTLTTTWTQYVNSSGNPSILYEGYETTRGDRTGVRPIVTSATNSIDLFTITNSSTGHFFRNIKFTHSAGTRGYGVVVKATGNTVTTDGCVFDGLLNALNGDNVGARFPFAALMIKDTAIKNCTGDGVLTNTGVTTVINSQMNDNTGNGLAYTASASGHIIAIQCDFRLNGGKGILAPITGTVSGLPVFMCVNCNFHDNTGDGVGLNNSATAASSFFIFLHNSIFWSNGGYGFNLNTALAIDTYIASYNAHGGNTSGELRNITAQEGDVTLTVDPFVSSSDFNLNETAGGGADCRGAGFPGTYVS